MDAGHDQTPNRNLDEIRNLSGELRLFHHEHGDWSQLRSGDLLKRIYVQAEERVVKRRGR